MIWMKWIFAYLFDCVHPHTTWPRRTLDGHAYVCCIDCGRELPYSLQCMRITAGEDRSRKPRNARSAVAVSRILVGTILLLNSASAAAQTSDGSASQAREPASTQSDAAPTIVIGFVGGFVHRDDLRHSEVRLAQSLQEMYGDRVHIQVFKNRQNAQAERAIIDWWKSLKDSTDTGEQTWAPQIILFGHSWGASEVVYLARELDRKGIPVALTIQVDSIRKHGKDDSVIPGNVAEAVNFYQSKGPIHGCSHVRAADPSRTKILGNFRIKYQNEPSECRIYPWYDRLLFKGHTAIECDPRVWYQIEMLIEARISPHFAYRTDASRRFRASRSAKLRR